MTIGELLTFRIKLFEINDKRLPPIICFFLHSAPTIDSVSAAQIPQGRLERNWTEYIKDWEEKSYKFYSPDYFSDANILEKFGLSDDSAVPRKEQKEATNISIIYTT